MFCEPWREALSAAALCGEEPPRAANLHLSDCGACRTAFAEECRLFAAVDQGLHALVNAELPASLIPRVRVAIAERPASSPWRLPTWAFAGAVLLLTAGIAYTWIRAPRSAAPSQPVAAVPSSPDSSPLVSNPQIAASPSRPAVSPRFNSVRSVIPRREPEILFSADEQANLLLYLNRRRTRNVINAAPQVILTGDASIQPLEIARLDVPELTIKPLDDGDSR